MKIASAACAFLALAAPQLAHADPSDDAKAFVQRYAAAFNKADVPQLVGLYIAPGDMPARLAAQLADLRGNEFGHMDLYDLKVCSATSSAASIAVHYDFAFTYGGVMPPSDRTTVLHLSNAGDGWRIAGADMLGGAGGGC